MKYQPNSDSMTLKKIYKMKKFYLILVAATLFFGCDEEEADTGGDFDKNRLLTEYANNYIIPSYKILRDSISTGFPSFTTATYFEDIRRVQNAWQRVAFLDFGPAMNYTLLSSFNTYPIDTARVEENINDIDKTDFGAASDINAIGFTAMDYVVAGLLEGEDEKFTQEELLFYVERLFDFHNEKVVQVTANWTTDYATDFIENDGNTLTSSLTVMINRYLFYYEKYFRDGKLGVPLGIRSNGVPLLGRLEMPSSETSWNVFVSSWKSIYNFYYNIGESDKYGLHDVLADRNVDAGNGKKTHEIIDEQFQLLDEMISNYQTDDFKQALLDQDQELKDIYQEVQKMVQLLKVDMTSALGISITYESNDGD